MSKKKRIVEIEPDGVSKEELFTFPSIRCPVCSGRGYFTEEVGRDTLKEAPCPYCEGAGQVSCTVFAWWRPHTEGHSSINNLKEFYYEVEKRGNC